MPDSPPRSPDWSAAAVARSSGEPNSTRHSTSTPAPAASGSRPPSSSGTRPSAPGDAHVQHARAAQRLGGVLERLDRAAARRRRIVARRARGDGHRLEVGGGTWGA